MYQTSRFRTVTTDTSGFRTVTTDTSGLETSRHQTSGLETSQHQNIRVCVKNHHIRVCVKKTTTSRFAASVISDLRSEQPPLFDIFVIYRQNRVFCVYVQNRDCIGFLKKLCQWWFFDIIQWLRAYIKTDNFLNFPDLRHFEQVLCSFADLGV